MEGASGTSQAELEQMADLLSVLGHPVRLQIVQGLLTEECCVSSMVDCLNLPQPLVSRHLGILRQAGVVDVERRGRQRSYRVVHPRARALLSCLRTNIEGSSPHKE
jgi:ArsR family transcriptional regulator